MRPVGKIVSRVYEPGDKYSHSPPSIQVERLPPSCWHFQNYWALGLLETVLKYVTT